VPKYSTSEQIVAPVKMLVMYKEVSHLFSLGGSCSSVNNRERFTDVGEPVTVSITGRKGAKVLAVWNGDEVGEAAALRTVRPSTNPLVGFCRAVKQRAPMLVRQCLHGCINHEV
jgi:hypothetical protein